MKKKFWFFILLIVSLVSTRLFAEKIYFSADSMTGSSNKTSNYTTLKGHAFIRTETMEISADSINISGDDYNNIVANGSVKGKNLESEMEFSCEEMTYDSNKKTAVLMGDVSLTDIQNNVDAKAQMVEYNSDSDVAVLQIDVQLIQKENVCSAAYAVYFKKTQMLNLSGNASIKQKDDTFRAQHITLNMESEEITLDGRVRGTVSEKQEEADVDE